MLYFVVKTGVGKLIINWDSMTKQMNQILNIIFFTVLSPHTLSSIRFNLGQSQAIPGVDNPSQGHHSPTPQTSEQPSQGALTLLIYLFSCRKDVVRTEKKHGKSDEVTSQKWWC